MTRRRRTPEEIRAAIVTLRDQAEHAQMPQSAALARVHAADALAWALGDADTTAEHMLAATTAARLKRKGTHDRG